MYINVRVSADEQSVDACRLADLISLLLKTPSDRHLPSIRSKIKPGSGAENPPPFHLLCSIVCAERIMGLHSRLNHTNQTWGKTVCIVANTSVIQRASSSEAAKRAVLFESALCFIHASFRISLSLDRSLLQPLSSRAWMESLDLVERGRIMVHLLPSPYSYAYSWGDLLCRADGNTTDPSRPAQLLWN